MFLLSNLLVHGTVLEKDLALQKKQKEILALKQKHHWEMGWKKPLSGRKKVKILLLITYKNMIILWACHLSNPMVLCFFSRLKQVYQNTDVALFAQKECNKKCFHGMDFLRFSLAFWVLLAQMIMWFVYANETSNRDIFKVFFVHIFFNHH